jgi:CubicO group peptidase (beta-lactamase class C family)
VNIKDDIRKYLPKNYPNLEYGGHPIRLLDLANHTSGLPNSMRSFPSTIQDSLRKLSLTEQVNFYALYKQDKMLADLHQIKLDTLLGVQYRYNSNGMTILILLLERIYKQDYGQLITNYLKKDFGIFDTKPELSLTEIKRAAQGYDRKNQPQEFANLKGFLMGPSMNSTTNDMVKFIEANLSEKNKAIKLTHQLTLGKKHGFGLGWMLDTESNGERYIYDDGNTKLGYNTLCTLYPGKNTGFIIMVNDNISQEKVGELENATRRNLSK